MSATVLVVADEPQLVRALSINLRARDHVVHAAGAAAQALELAARHRPDAVLLDLGLPDADGVRVVEGLRGWSRVPIVVLSARQDGLDAVRALDAGADDYVSTPLRMHVLLARLRAALRPGAAGDADEPEVDVGAFVVDLARGQVRRDGEVVRLTPSEWRLLEELARHHGRLVSPRHLLQKVWGPAHESETDYLRLYVDQLRRKLEPAPSAPVHLLTEAGMGLRLQGPADDQSRGT